MGFEFGNAADPAESRADRPAIVSNTQVTRLKGPLGLLVLLALLAVGVGLAWVDCDLILSHRAMRSWQEVPAKILRAKLLSGHHDSGTERAMAEYAYTFDNVDYRSKRVSWGLGYDNLGPFQANAYAELSAHQRSGRPFRCFVNPADPTQAILYRDLRPEVLVLFSALEMMLGLPLLIAALGGLWQFAVDWRTRQYRARQAEAHPAEPWLWRADWAAGQMRVSGWQKKIGVTFFACAWNLAALPLYVHLPWAPAGTFWPRVCGLGLIAVGWPLAWWAVSTWRRPTSILQLASVPAMCGDRFGGQIETTARPNASGGFSLLLRCVRFEERADREQQRVLWEETRLVSSPEPGRNFGTLLVPVDFALPADGVSTDHVAEQDVSRVAWQLIVDAAGSDGSAIRIGRSSSTTVWSQGQTAQQGIALFEVPIFSPHAYVAPATDETQLAVPARSSEAPAQPAVELTPLGFVMRWALGLIFAAFFLMPLFFWGLYWSMVAEWQAMRSWAVVPATIVKARLVDPLDDDNRHDHFDVTAEYEYESGGQIHHGTKISPFVGSDNLGSFQHAVYRELAEHERSGQPFRCFVNPADPAQAVLYRELRADLMVPLAGLSLTVGLGMLFVPLAADGMLRPDLRGWRFRRAERARHPNEPWLWREDWASREIVASNQTILKLLAVAAVVWNLFTLPLWMFLPAGTTSFGYRMSSVALIGISWLLALGAIRLWRSPKRSVLRLSQVPATLGGELVGQIETTVPPGESGVFRLALRCVRLNKVRQSNRRGQTTQEDLVWEANQTTGKGAAAGGFEQGPIAVRFKIPATLPQTDDIGIGEARASRVVWRVVLDFDPPTRLGIATFEVPVFRAATDAAAESIPAETKPS